MNNAFSLIKKGILMRLNNIKIPNKKQNKILIKYLYKNNYLFNYKIKFNYIIINIKYFENKSIIRQVNINNKKKKRFYKIKYKELRRQFLSYKKDLLILSKYGIINYKKAMNYKIGGNILVKIVI